MAVRKIQGLKGLKSFESLSSSEYNAWKRQNAQYLKGFYTYDQEKELYETQRFVGKYGKDAARQYTHKQRLAIEQQDIDNYNNQVIREQAGKFFSPFKDDGSLDPDKGTGDEALYYKIMGLEPMFLKELYENDLFRLPSDFARSTVKDKNGKVIKDEDGNVKTRPTYSEYVVNEYKKIQEKEEKFQKNHPIASATVNRGMAGGEIGLNIADTEHYGAEYSNTSIDAVYNHLKSQSDIIFENTLIKDRDKKTENAKPVVEQTKKLYDQMSAKDIDKAFIRIIFPSEENPGIPRLASFYNKDGSIKSSEVENLTTDDKKEWLSKWQVYNDVYGPDVAYDILNQEAHKYIAEHQSGWETTLALSKDTLITGAGYAMDIVNGYRVMGEQSIEGVINLFGGDTKQVPAYTDGNGNYYGIDQVKNGIYTDPVTGKQTKVRQTNLTYSQADELGIAWDGKTYSAIFSNQYWSDAETTKEFSREAQLEAKKLNGYSSSQAVWELGDKSHTLYESAKMSGFALTDMAITAILSYATGGTGLLAKIPLIGKTLAKVGRITAKTLHYAHMFGSNVGLGNAYQRGAFGEMFANNMENLENTVVNVQNAQLSKDYEEPGNPVRYQIQDRARQLTQDKLTELGKNGDLNGLSQQDIDELTESLQEDAYKQAMQEEVNRRVEEYKKSDEYQSMADEALRLATNHAMGVFWAESAKYAAINVFGYRNILFRDPYKVPKYGTNTLAKGVEEVTKDNGKKALVNNSEYMAAKKTLESTTASTAEKAAAKKTMRSIRNKTLGKAALSQAWGGAWTNYTDEWVTGGARAANDYAFEQVIRDEYGEDAGVEFDTYHSNILGAYFSGVAETATKDTSLEAGLIGAIGSLISGMPNAHSILHSKEARQQWKDGDFFQKVGTLYQNGFLSKYNELLNTETARENMVNYVNELVDEFEDFDAIRTALQAKIAEKDAVNKDDADLTAYINAVIAMRQLRAFQSKLDPQSAGIAAKSSIYTEAVNRMKAIEKGELTQEQIEELLTEYYARNPGVSKTEEHHNKAMETIQENVAILQQADKDSQDIEAKLDKIEQKRGKAIPSVVKNHIIARAALDKAMDRKLGDLEYEVSGFSTPTENITEDVRTVEAKKQDLKDLENLQNGMGKQIAKAEKKVRKAEKEYNDYLESLKEKGVNKKNPQLLKEEADKLSELQNKMESAKMDVRHLERLRDNLKERHERLLEEHTEEISTETTTEAENSKGKKKGKKGKKKTKEQAPKRKIKDTSSRVLTAKEIITADPETRARMLNPFYRGDYTKAQQLEIEQAEAQLNAKDTELLEKVQVIADLSSKKRANQQAFTDMQSNPEAAEVSLEENSEVNAVRRREAQQRTFSGIINDQIKYIEEEAARRLPGKKNEVERAELIERSIQHLVTDQFQSQRSQFFDTLAEYDRRRYGKYTRFQKYAATIKHAAKMLDIHQDVRMASHELQQYKEGNDARRQGIGISVDNLLEGVETKDDAIRALDEGIDSKDVDEFNKQMMRDLKAKLLDVWKLQAATKEKEATETTREDTDTTDNQDNTTTTDENTTNDVDEDVSNDQENNDVTDAEIEDALKDGEEFEIDFDETLEDDAVNTLKDNPDAEITVGEVPTTDGESQQTPPTTNTANTPLVGHALSKYTVDPVTNAVTLTEKVLARKLHNFLEKQGIDLQGIVDYELQAIAALNPTIHLACITYRHEKNSEADIDLCRNATLAVIEYTDEVAKVHDEKRGGVIESNGKKYLIIGTIGYHNSASRKSKAVVHKLREYLDIASESSTDQFYVEETSQTSIKKVYSGYKTNVLPGEEKPQVRSIKDLVNDPKRNPKGLKLGQLKWGIQKKSQFATVGVPSTAVVYSPNKISTDANSGMVFLLMEGADGAYIPVYIEPTTVNQLKEGSEVKGAIDNAIRKLYMATTYEGRVAALQELSNLIVIHRNREPSEKNFWINIGEKGSTSIYLQLGNNVLIGFDMTDAGRERHSIEDFIKAIMDQDPRVSVTLSDLMSESTIERLSDAGALNTDIASLSPLAVNYTVNEMDSGGREIITEDPVPPTPAERHIVESETPWSRRAPGTKIKVAFTPLTKGKDGKWHTRTRGGKEVVLTTDEVRDQMYIDRKITSGEADVMRINVDGKEREVYIINEGENVPTVVYRSADKFGLYNICNDREAKRISKFYDENRAEGERKRRRDAELEAERRRQGKGSKPLQEEVPVKKSQLELYNPGETIQIYVDKKGRKFTVSIDSTFSEEDTMNNGYITTYELQAISEDGRNVTKGGLRSTLESLTDDHFEIFEDNYSRDDKISIFKIVQAANGNYYADILLEGNPYRVQLKNDFFDNIKSYLFLSKNNTDSTGNNNGPTVPLKRRGRNGGEPLPPSTPPNTPPVPPATPPGKGGRGEGDGGGTPPGHKRAEEVFGRILDDGSTLHLTDDGTYYEDSQGNRFMRVTNVVGLVKGQEKMDPNSPWITPSTTLGTQVHEFVEDFLHDNAGNPESYSERYPNGTNEAWQALAKQLKQFKQEYGRLGTKFKMLGTEVPISGQLEVQTKDGTRIINVAGTIDMLLCDQDGKFVIFDFKTNRSPRISAEKLGKWQLQTSIYAKLLADKYGVPVRGNARGEGGTTIVPFVLTNDSRTEGYPAPKGYKNGTAVYTTEERTVGKDAQGNDIVRTVLQLDGKDFTGAKPTKATDLIELKRLEEIKVETSRMTPEEYAEFVFDPNDTRVGTGVAPTETAPTAPTTPISIDINDTLGGRSITEIRNARRAAESGQAPTGEAVVKTAKAWIMRRGENSVVQAARSKLEALGISKEGKTKVQLLEALGIDPTANISEETLLDMINNCR